MLLKPMCTCAVVTLLALAVPAAAQDEAALRSAFEGKRVTLRIDMPGTSDGVDVQGDATFHEQMAGDGRGHLDFARGVKRGGPDA